jgi:hypothetical protein
LVKIKKILYLIKKKYSIKLIMKRYFLYIIATISFFFTTPVYAYLDPGTGGMILQAILAFIAASIATLSFYWNKVKILFIKLLKKKYSINNI